MRTFALLRRGLGDEARERGWPRALFALLARLAGVVRESFPDRRRMRFGDIQYDLEHNVNTTWANVAFTTRLREALIAADYQTTDPLVFAEAMDMLKAHADLEKFTFVDLGSGKGRVLLMAAEYPFRRIIGVELLPELDAIARVNVSRDPRLELILADARDFVFPSDPFILFLFNPFPTWVLRDVLRNLQRSLEAAPRAVFLIFHNAVHESELATGAPGLRRLGGTYQFVLYGSVP